VLDVVWGRPGLVADLAGDLGAPGLDHQAVVAIDRPKARRFRAASLFAMLECSLLVEGWVVV